MTAAHRTAAAFLRRAGLMAAVLAVIAGIFGMHVLTGTHAMHSPATVTGATSTHHADASGDDAMNEGSLEMPDSSGAGHAGVHATAGQCSDSGACSGMQSMTAACIPSPKTASLAAPPPGTLVAGISNSTATARDVGRWTYLPGSPSPCELSISRT
jgi:hypothetical protein